MKIKQGKEEYYNRFVELNSKDSLSKMALEFIHKWANLMEKQLSEGKKIEDIADKAAIDAGIDNISGSMYEFACSTLYNCWDYGEELHSFYDAKL